MLTLAGGPVARCCFVKCHVMTPSDPLLEEGCEEFSNVHGLGQIRFPRGNIAHAFEEVRRVLEREELVDAP